MTSISEGLEKTLQKRRGYSLGNWKTYFEETEKETVFALIHYGTTILEAKAIGLQLKEVQCSEHCEEIKGLDNAEWEKCKTCSAPHEDLGYKIEVATETWELISWDGWSPSDRDRINEALSVLGLRDIAHASNGIGGFFGSGRPLELWLNGIPRNHDLTPSVDLEALEKQIKSLRAIFKVEYAEWFGTSEGKLQINPKNSYQVLDVRNKNGFDRLNGFSQNMAIVRVIPSEDKPYTRLILEVDKDRLNEYSVNVLYHNTIPKALAFITRNADFRQGDLCFKKLRRIPESTIERRAKRWNDEENEDVKIVGERVEITHKREVVFSMPFEDRKGFWDWTPNENPHRFKGNFTMYRLEGNEYLEAHSEVTISHKEHEDLTLPKGFYRFYQVRGLESTRRGAD